MAVLEVVTRIHAPVERCFDLSRDVGVHCRTAAFTGERVLPPGRTDGLLELGDQVIFEAVHLGVRQRFTARIVELEFPRRYVDEMVSGAFKSFRHVHTFEVEGPVTVMRDHLEWVAPLGPLGSLADLLFLQQHMRWFAETKQANLKHLAEHGTLPG